MDKEFLVSFNKSLLEAAIIKSSTQTIRITLELLECLVYTQLSHNDCLKFKAKRKLCNVSFHSLPLCFKPYKDFLSFITKLLPFLSNFITLLFMTFPRFFT